jgi:hypothetical protein
MTRYGTNYNSSPSRYFSKNADDQPDGTTFRKSHTIDQLCGLSHILTRHATNHIEAKQIYKSLYDILIRTARAYGAIEVEYYKLDICTRLTFKDNFVAEKYLMRCVFGNTVTTPFDAPIHVSTRNGWLMEFEGAIDTLELIKLKIEVNERTEIYDLLAQAQHLLSTAIKQCQKMDDMMDLLLISEDWVQNMSDSGYDDMEAGLGDEWGLFMRCLERKDSHVERSARLYLASVDAKKAKSKTRY